MKAKRVLSLLLMAAMVIGMLPSVALLQVGAASAGDKTSETYGTLNGDKSVSLPITVHNYPNDGMLFEYASYVGTEQYTYARAHAEKVTPAYGESWYAHGDRSGTVADTTMTYLGMFYVASKANKSYFLCHDATSDHGVKLYGETSGALAEENKRWNVYKDSNGYFHFINVGTGLALDKNGGEKNLHGWTANTSTNQQWSMSANADGSYKIFSVYDTGLIVDLANGTVADGNEIRLYDSDNGSAAQSWFLLPVNGNETAIAGMSPDAMRVIRTTSDVSSDVGAYAAIINQSMAKENARYLTLVYNVETEASDLSGFAPFKIVPITGESSFAMDVNGGSAADGTKIQLWTSKDSDPSTTKYLLPEAAGDGSFYLAWYRSDANGGMTASGFYVGGITGSNVQAVCKPKSSANRFYILANDDGSYSFQVADYSGVEPLYITNIGSQLADGRPIGGWTWTNGDDQKFYLRTFAGQRITFAEESFKLYPGFDGQDTALASVNANALDVTLSTAPGYHTVTLDLSTAAGYAAAEKLSSLSVSTAAGKRVTLSLAAVGGFAAQTEAENFGNGVLAGMADVLVLGSYTASKHWKSTNSSDWDANKSADKVRRYRMGNNLAYGMLLPNSGYNTASSYYQWNNFGYASRWGSDTTVQDNLSAGKWASYEVSNYTYRVSSSANDGRWFVQTQGETGQDVSSTNRPLVTLNGESYNDISKFLPNMHSYINGMATIGLIEYELDPVTKKPVYTQETVQKLAALLQKSLSISEVNDASNATYNYNFVQGEKTLNGKDWAQSIRDLGITDATTSVPESAWADYINGHKSQLSMSWDEVKGHLINYLDVAYWMLNTLYASGNGISEDVPEYTHLTLTLETNSDGKSYYVFDGGYNDVEYNALNGGISHTGSDGVKEFVYYSSTAETTAHPFLPTTGSSTYRQTNTPYYADDGAGTRQSGVYNTYIDRDFSYSMEGHGQFVFNIDDDLYFRFEGDDDVYLFINNKLVMDIGGAHSITKTTFNLNDYIKECGLEDGGVYDFDFYYMERHGYGANLRIETNIDITSKYVETVKGAKQNGTEVDNYGLVDKTQALEYYFTLSNTGYELPLTDIAFTDSDIGFSAGYNGVNLGSYTLNGTTYNRDISQITATLTLVDKTEINITFADIGALQSFLTDVKCEGHEKPGLAAGERLTISGIRYGLTKNGVFKNTVYSEASSIRGSASFAVFAGTAQQYFMWAGHPIAVSVGDAASTALGDVQISDFVPSTGNGVTSSVRPLADGVYSIGTATVISSDPSARRFSWAPKSGSGHELEIYSANDLYDDGVEGNEPLFYVKYAGNGYYTILNLQYNEYVYIDKATGTNSSSKNDTVDLDDRLKLASMTEAEAASNDSALWLIERNTAAANISPNSTRDSFVIRPKLGLKYGVDLDSADARNGGKVHLWTVSDSTNAGWYFNAHANGDGNMTGFEDNILIFEESKAGTYTRYFKATYDDNGKSVTTNIPVVLHVLDVKDDTYVLDYGLPVDLSDVNDGGLTNNDLIRPTGINTNTTIEGLVSGEAYNGLKQLSKDGKLTTKTNGVSGNTTDEYISSYGTFSADNGAVDNSSKNVRSTELSTQANGNEWSDTKPSGYADDQLETRTLYRYRDRTSSSKTETGSADYVNFPSGFDKNNALYTKYNGKQVTGVTTTSTQTVGYVYWHWCRNVALGSPYYRQMQTAYTTSGGYTTFHAWENANYASSISGGYKVTSYSSWMDSSMDVVAFGDPGSSSSGPCASSASKQYCTDSFCWYALPILRQNWSKTTTTASWGNWSDWSTEIATASGTRQVEQKTQYRVKDSSGGESGGDVDIDINSRKAYRISLASDTNWVLSINDASTMEWSTEKPAGYSDSQLESRTLYRYRTLITTTNTETHTTQYVNTISALSPYQSTHGLYQAYQRGPTTGEGITTVKTEDDGYVCWHYCANGGGGPVLRFAGYYYNQQVSGRLGDLTTFHSWHSDIIPTAYSGAQSDDNNLAYNYGTGIPGVLLWDPGYVDDWYHVCTGNPGTNVCKDTIRWLYTPLYKQTWTKTTSSSSWSDWSDWSTTAVSASDARQVETKTEYRVKEDLTASAGTAVALQARDDANTAQLWYLQKQSDGSVIIENAKSGMTMQISASAASGVSVVQMESTGASAEKWKLTKISEDRIAIQPFNTTGYYVDLTEGNKSQNQAIQIWGNATPNQNEQWILNPIYQSDTYSRLIFTPQKFMNGASSAKAIIRVNDSSKTPSVGLGNVDVHKEVEMYEQIITIPASVVYYEDIFEGIDYSENTDSKIENIGGGDGDFQNANQNEQYGHDGHYENEGYEASGGSVTKITVTADEQILSFKFRGTGFEIISRATANCSANIIATVYNASGTQIREIPVITEYNNNGGAKGDEAIYQVPAISVNDLVAGDYTVKISVTSRQTYDGWTTQYVSYENGVIRYSLTNADGVVYYKYYNVAENKSTFTDANGNPCDNPMLVVSYLFIDGVRIFNPIEGLTDGNGNDLDSSYTGSEKGAKIHQIHDEILAGNILVAETTADSVNIGTGLSTFTENRNSNLINGNKADSVNDYALVGPNNEVYLDGLSMRQALAFYVRPDASVKLEDRTLQIGVRALDAAKSGGYTELQLSDRAKTTLMQSNANDGSPAWTQMCELTAGVEQYYVLDPMLCTYDAQKDAYLVLVMPVDGLVSFTGLKMKGYDLVPSWDAGSVEFGPDGMLTEASVEIVNKMLADFVPQLDSTANVEARSVLNNQINITLSSPTEPEKPDTGKTDEGKTEPEKPEPGETDPSETVESPFPDARGTWYEEAVAQLSKDGILKGFEDGNFHGEEGLTREQFAAMLVRALKLQDTGKGSRFTDISGRWSENEILIASSNGLVNGVSATEFAPELEITRQEMMTMIARALRNADAELPKPADLKQYQDADRVASWALDSVKLLVATGIINGKSDTELAPEGKCLRCEAAAVIYRLLEQLAKN